MSHFLRQFHSTVETMPTLRQLCRKIHGTCKMYRLASKLPGLNCLIAVTGLSLLCALPQLARATETTTLCTLVTRVSDGATIHHTGTGCDTRYSPASTFKLALALIGYETNLLASPDAPAIDYDPAINAPFSIWRETTYPRRWLRYSVVWYSQWLTTQLGAAKFQNHVDALNYGNRDLSGDPGQNNGLTRAWLGSSLKISPLEQSRFLRAFVTQSLPLSDRAQTLTKETMQHFSVGPHDALGKTGTTWVRDANYHRTKDQLGWFVGWVVKDNETYVFVRLTQETAPSSGYAGSRTQTSLLADLPDLLP
ncbi:penicillin-binding transpeptidase domain-containing protein [Shimia sp.]|uniref:penicillin-binding transpeptidase domain-containing protein n=1 Tax=Shimia sp. TaxID=1954381 RepID=UPI0032998854